MIAAIDTVRNYSQIVQQIARAVWRLLFINLLILAIVAFTILFTDISRHKDLEMIHIVLTGLILYFIHFPCIKALIHLVSLHICRMRLDESRMQLAELIPEPDYIVYIKQPLQKIRNLFRIYPLVVLLHLAMAFACYYLKYYVL